MEPALTAREIKTELEVNAAVASEQLRINSRREKCRGLIELEITLFFNQRARPRKEKTVIIFKKK
jgi:hypothetical protein